MPIGFHRSYGAHHLHFITCPCYRRLPFLNRARSRDCFLSILDQVRARYRFVVVGDVVMPERIYLLITEPEIGNPSKIMQVLKQRTARALLPKRKRKDPRQGRLFGEESQPRAEVAGEKTLAACVRGSRPCKKRKSGAPTMMVASATQSLGHPPPRTFLAANSAAHNDRSGRNHARIESRLE